jgi:hypothetical protein
MKAIKASLGAVLCVLLWQQVPAPKVVAQAEPSQAEIRVGKTQRIPPGELARKRMELAQRLAEQGHAREAAHMAGLAASDPAVEQIASQAPAVRDYTCDTYPIRARGYRIDNGAAAFPSGSCVSVGGGQFFTCAHIADGLRPGYVVEIQVEGEWHKTTQYQANIKADVAKAVIAKDVPGVKVRPVEFGEAVTIYGLTTCEPQSGVYVGDGHVGLERSCKGVDFGDSGGGVYGEDGSLVGLISGFGDDRRSVFVSVIDTVEPVQAEAPQPVPTPAPKSSCPGGVCPKPYVSQPSYPLHRPRGRFFR